MAEKYEGEVKQDLENGEEEDGEQDGEVHDGEEKETRTEGLVIVCDGRCGITWTFADDIYYCRDCLNVAFDQGCLETLRTGTLDRKICHPNHKFFHIPKWDVEGGGKVPKGYVKVGGKVVDVKDWLNNIRRKFGFGIELEN
jgi:hypothetical protein